MARRGASTHRVEIDAWVKRELSKPAARKPLTPPQLQVLRSVLANHEALKTKTG